MIKPKPSYKILVIDDDLGMCRMLEKWFLNAGREVILASSAAVGLMRAQDEKPDVVVVDLMLPDIGGLEVARRLKQGPLTEQIPLVFISSCVNNGHADEGEYETLEIDERRYPVFSKPLKHNLTLDLVDRLVRRRHNNLSWL